MVPPLTPEMRAADPTLIVVEPYKELPVDRAGLGRPVPAIVGMEPCDNFAAYTARKLYIHNCGHAVLAYLGHLAGPRIRLPGAGRPGDPRPVRRRVGRSRRRASSQSTASRWPGWTRTSPT